MAAMALPLLLMPSNLITTGQGPITLIIRIINYAVGLLELLLGIRFLLRIAGANAGNGFVAFIYQFSDMFMTPFRSIFPRSVVEGSVVEWSTLFAMAIYAVLAYALIQLILLMVPHTDIVEVETVEVV